MSTMRRRLRNATTILVATALAATTVPAFAADNVSTPHAAGGQTTAPVITTTIPSLQGTPAVGQRLSAKVTGWKPAPSLAYQWLRGGAPIPGATRSAYQLTVADYGKRISVRVTGTVSGYPAASATSASVKAAAGTLTPKAAIAGKQKVGYTVKASLGSWGVSGVKYTYRWYANGKSIKGATKQKLKVTPALYRKRLSVKVKGVRPAYRSATITTKSRAKVAAGTIKAGKVTVKGTLTQTRTVKAKLSGWSPKNAKYSYQWYASGKKIRGATKSTYTIAPSMVGKKLKVKVTATAKGYAKRAKTSASSKPVTPVNVDARCRAAGRVICADKTARKVYRMQNGKMLDAFDARFGRAGMRTRSGTFTLYFKSANQYSYLYKVWMPYAEFFSGGQGVHYSADFAANGWGVGSHGCVNLRDYAGAKRLFNWARTGDKVIVYGKDH